MSIDWSLDLRRDDVGQFLRFDLTFAGDSCAVSPSVGQHGAHSDPHEVFLVACGRVQLHMSSCLCVLLFHVQHVKTRARTPDFRLSLPLRLSRLTSAGYRPERRRSALCHCKLAEMCMPVTSIHGKDA
jgi:hypothetical protein